MWEKIKSKLPQAFAVIRIPKLQKQFLSYKTEGMEDKSNVSIFQGSAVEADTVHDYLAQNNIGSLVRNHMHETLDAGWVTAEANHAAEVFVAVEDSAKAQDLLKNLFVENEPTDRAPAPGNATIIVEPSVEPSSTSERRPTPPPPTPPVV